MSADTGFSDLLRAAADLGLSFNDPEPAMARYWAIDGLRLHFLDWGRQGNPPMLLLHGAAVTAHSWDFFSLAMRPSFHVYALDHRGHGDSAWDPSRDYRRERLAGDVADFTERFALSPLVLVGHSMGGAVALLAARQMLEIVEAIVIVDSTLGPRTRPSRVQRFIQGPDRFASLEAMARHASRFNPRRDLRKLVGSLRHNARQLPDGQWTWKYDPALRDPSKPRPPADFDALWEALETLPCPILVVRASDRSHISDDLVPRLDGLAPRVRLVTVPDSGHSVMGDNPSAFQRAVTEFLNDCGLLGAGLRPSSEQPPAERKHG